MSLSPTTADGAIFNRLWNVIVAVRIATFHGDKKCPGLHSTAVDGNSGDRNIGSIRHAKWQRESAKIC